MKTVQSQFGTDFIQVPNLYKTGQSSLMRIRISLKLLIVLFTVILILTTLSYWRKCETSIAVTRKQWHFKEPCQSIPSESSSVGVDVFQFDDDDSDDKRNQMDLDRIHLRSGLRALEEIECSINDEYTVPCRQDGGEIYLPFSFLHKYFEVYGKVVKHGGVERFEWQHSYSKVYFPKHKYDPSGLYLWFENYNVEVRDRVKCISAVEGIPVSTQWDTRGHFYPIQIAQFGLSHFSKNFTDASYSLILLEDGDVTSHGHWKFPERNSKDIVKKLTDAVVSNTVLEFKTYSPNKEIVFSMDEELEETTFSCDIMPILNSSVTVILSSPGDSMTYKIHYIMSDTLLTATDTEVYYGIGKSVQWKTLTRDLVIDLNKGLPTAQNRRKMSSKPRNLRVRSIAFSGFGRVDNISLASSSHMAHFFSAANWFVNHQDAKGGWPNMVTRKLSNGMLELAPGWYSAMAQGQAMSLLTRAFKVTRDLHYLEAAMRAINLFSIRSENHGILTTFLGKYVWYEEYPTVPSSYVLNGFIYSLFGLYDVKQSCTHEHCRLAGQLFEDGIVSLKKMLPLFDTGSGSVYDLRHYSLGISPNLARWDYHSTHINQLLFLNTIHEDPLLKSVSERWAGYMKGKKAPHN